MLPATPSASRTPDIGFDRELLKRPSQKEALLHEWGNGRAEEADTRKGRPQLLTVHFDERFCTRSTMSPGFARTLEFKHQKATL